MISNVTDIDHIATRSIHAEHFATSELIGANEDDPICEVLAWMQANDFDVAPIHAKHEPGFVRRDDLEHSDPHDTVGHVKRSLAEALIVKPDTPFRDALSQLGSRGWFFIGSESRLDGIATRHDLGRPAVTLYLFAQLLALETGLRRLLGTYTNTQIPDAVFDRGTDDLPTNFSQVLNRVKKVDKLRIELGFDTKNKFDNATGRLVNLRNHLAHGRSILKATDKLDEAIELMRTVESLLGKVTALASDRDQVWEAFSNVQIVKRKTIETFWTGPAAVDLELPGIVYVITAENPYEEVLSAEENEKRNGALQKLLEAKGLQFVRVIGQSPDGNWSEESFAIAGLSRQEACNIGGLMKQRAVIELDDTELRIVSVDGQVRKTRERKS